jgi:hypothetical protein
MTIREKLVEQHALEYGARLRHVDELMKQESELPVATERSILLDELDLLRLERQQYLNHIEQLRLEVRREWQENGIEDVGPMILWEAVAKRLEGLIHKA